jgi:cytochrome P450
MLRSTYDDGSAMSRKDIGDELLTLLAAGHETTAATLAWAFERLTRHPDVLAALAREADEGGNELRQATILEVQRVRTVIDFAPRRAASMRPRSNWASGSFRAGARSSSASPRYTRIPTFSPP